MTIEAKPGSLRLVAVGPWGIRPGSDPPTRSCRVDTVGASDRRTRMVGAPGVVHARINVDSVRPWLGRAGPDRRIDSGRRRGLRDGQG